MGTLFLQKNSTQAMEIKVHDTFWQRREIRGMDPILLEVLEVEEVIGIREICKVRWHILGKDSVSTSVFPMPASPPATWPTSSPSRAKNSERRWTS